MRCLREIVELSDHSSFTSTLSEGERLILATSALSSKNNPDTR
jgi:hypothetical protein